MWWCTLVIPPLRKPRQEDCCQFKVSLVSSRLALDYPPPKKKTETELGVVAHNFNPRV